MKEEKLNFSIILRIGLSLSPILFNLPFPAMLWCSFNIAMSYVAYGPLTSVVSSLSAVCIAMFFCGMFGGGAMIYGLYLALEAILCAGACIYTVAKRKDFYTGLWLGTVGHLVPSVLGLKVQASEAGKSIVNYMADGSIESMRAQLEQITSDPRLQLEPEIINKLMEKLHAVTVAIIPSILIMASVLVSYIVMWGAFARLRRMPGCVEHSFSLMKIPRTMVLVSITALVVYILDIDGTVSSVALNVFVVMLYLTCFAGLSMVDFYLRRGIRFTPLRLLIYFGAFMFMSYFVVFGLIGTGIVDSFFDFRKIRDRRLDCETEE